VLTIVDVCWLSVRKYMSIPASPSGIAFFKANLEERGACFGVGPGRGGRFASSLVREPICVALRKDSSSLVTQSLQVADNQVWLPSHVASRCSSSIQVVRFVTRQHPEAARMRTDDGWMPLHNVYFRGAAAACEITKVVLDFPPWR
jgi:hypothetical protein